VVRLVWTQFFKRSPVNLRKILAVKPGYNPQALGLFLQAYATLYRQFGREADLEAMLFLVRQIKESRIDGYAGACWGYNFPWQARWRYRQRPLCNKTLTAPVKKTDCLLFLTPRATPR